MAHSKKRRHIGTCKIKMGYDLPALTRDDHYEYQWRDLLYSAAGLAAMALLRLENGHYCFFARVAHVSSKRKISRKDSRWVAKGGHSVSPMAHVVKQSKRWAKLARASTSVCRAFLLRVFYRQLRAHATTNSLRSTHKSTTTSRRHGGGWQLYSSASQTDWSGRRYLYFTYCLHTCDATILRHVKLLETASLSSMPR